MPEVRYDTFQGLKADRLEEILNGVGNVKIGFIGDLCIDIYWMADMSRSEISRETPHFPLPVVEEWMSPGAGGNVVSNIAALKPKELFVTGIIGDDWRGSLLQNELKKRDIDTSNIIISKKRSTNTYCKPMKKGLSSIVYEDPRLDFSNYEKLQEEDEAKLALYLEEIADKADILCVSDQFQYGCITPLIRDRIIRIAKQGLKVVVDSRDRIGLYTDAILKPNEMEGYRAVNMEADPVNGTFENSLKAAIILSERNRSGVCKTLGPNGCMYVDRYTKVHIPSCEVTPPIDTCGAGDTFLSAFSCALAAGALPSEAGAFANIASDVIISKIGTTGTASADEMKKRCIEIMNWKSERR